MPELPDVENFKRYLDRKARNKTIKHVEVRAGKILQKTSGRKLTRALTQRKIRRSRRHGKHLFAGLDDGHWLAMHFGMTGFLDYFKTLDEDPAHDRLRLDFANGWHLAFVNQRKLGKLQLIEAPDDFIAEEKLGPDALDRTLALKKFRELLAGRRGAIKAVLMDQSLIAGIGNIYSDEILFQAGLHPAAPVDRLDKRQTATLHRVMRRVLKTAIKKGAGSEALFERAPRSFLLRNREQGAPCPRCGGTVKVMKAAGRTAYYCPKCQRK